MYVQWHCLPCNLLKVKFILLKIFSNTFPHHIFWPMKLPFWIDPKPEHLQQNFISTNLFITLLWAKFHRFFFLLPFKAINQKMCKRGGFHFASHPPQQISREKCSLFVFCTQEGVETCHVSIAWNLSLIFFPTGSLAWPQGLQFQLLSSTWDWTSR